MTERGDILRELSALNLGLGVVKGQNEIIIEEQKNASNGRKELYRMHEENQAALAITMNSLGHVVEDVKAVKTDISDLQGFRIKLALAAVMVATAVTGAVNLIWIAIANFGQIKTVFRDLLK